MWPKKCSFHHNMHQVAFGGRSLRSSPDQLGSSARGPIARCQGREGNNEGKGKDGIYERRGGETAGGI